MRVCVHLHVLHVCVASYCINDFFSHETQIGTLQTKQQILDDIEQFKEAALVSLWMIYLHTLFSVCDRCAYTY